MVSLHFLSKENELIHMDRDKFRSAEEPVKYMFGISSKSFGLTLRE